MSPSFVRIILPVILVLWLATSCTDKQPPQLVEFTGPAQGTSYHFSCWGPGADRITQGGIDSILDHVNESLSTYQHPSTINLFNEGDFLRTDDTLFVSMLRIAERITRLTDGAFDPTVMPLVRAWGFGPDNSLVPTTDNLDSLRQFVGIDRISIEEETETYVVEKTSRGVQLDFNAIAQGYTVDLLAAYYDKAGVRNYLIELGGEAIARGENTTGDAWTLGIEKPVDLVGISEVAAYIEVSGRAIATSGNYRKFYEKDGVRYSHTIDPATGRPVTHSLLSVTVLADDCATADALATAFMVMGQEKALAFVDAHPELNLEAYFITSLAPGNYQFAATDGLSDLLEESE